MGQFLGLLAGVFEPGLDIRLLAAVVLILAGVIWPARALLAGERWAWFVVSLECAVAIVGSWGAVYRLVRLGLEDDLGAGNQVFAALVAGFALACFGVGGTALVYLNAPRTVAFFDVSTGRRRAASAAILATCLVVVALAVIPPWRSGTGVESLPAAVRLRTLGEASASDDAAFEFMLDRLRDGSDEERLNAAWALGRSGREEAAPPLASVARADDDVNVRLNAIQALAELDAAELLQLYDELLADADPNVPQVVLAQIAAPEHAGLIESIVPLLGHEDPGVRGAAADTLGAIAHADAMPALLAATGDREDDVRSRAAFALGRLRDPRAANALITLLGDGAWEVRANAAQALGMVGATSARRDLERLLNDPNAQVRAVAELALDRLAAG